MLKIVFQYTGETINLFEAAGRPTGPVDLEIVVPKGVWPTVTFTPVAQTLPLPDGSNVTVDFSAGPTMGDPCSGTDGPYMVSGGAGYCSYASGGAGGSASR